MDALGTSFKGDIAMGGRRSDMTSICRHILRITVGKYHVVWIQVKVQTEQCKEIKERCYSYHLREQLGDGMRF